MNIVDTAIRLAIENHAGELNVHDGEVYLLHVHRVASNFSEVTLDDQVAKAVAWLHDCIEDTDLTLSDILKAFDPITDHGIALRIVDGVDAMTKRKGESNKEYYWRVKRNADATRVKIADILDNFGRNHTLTDEDKRLRMAQKYSLGLDILCRQH